MTLSGRRWVSRIAAVLGTSVVIGALTTTPASAASVVGSTFVPSVPCGAPVTYVQTSSPGTSYTVPASGVITSWRFQAPASNVPQIKFKAFRPAGGSSFTVIGESAAVLPSPNTFTSFPIRVPVTGGDIIGLAVLTGGLCAASGSLHYISGDSAVGSTLPYAPGMGTMDVEAIVEQDTDRDGYGDETQDQCPTQATTQGACDLDPPQTTITKGPQPTRRTTVRFVFVSDEPGAVFECRLKGKKVRSPQLQEYRPCTSPKKYKNLLVGDYKFQARAIDVAGNRDRTPDRWKFQVLPKS